MRVHISIHSLASKELAEAADYYLERDPLVALDFLKNFELSLNEIRNNPLSSILITPLVRRKLFRRFPYAIYYYALASEARIVAVAHQSRRPLYWLDAARQTASLNPNERAEKWMSKFPS